MMKNTVHNRSHAIIAGFSWLHDWFSRLTFYLSGENSVRFSATAAGSKPLRILVKKILLNILFLIAILFFSCQKVKEEKPLQKNDVQKTTEPKEKNYLEETLKTVPKNAKPIFGYRFIVEGDFDGDGKKEKLTEHYISTKTKKETNKFYENLTELEQLIALTISKWPNSYVISDNKEIDTLKISEQDQQIGLSYLKNEGDLNHDGGDEISYVVNYADYSNINSWHIMTYKNKKWEELYSFGIWDWQLPDLPETFNQYGLFGLEEKIINTQNDSANKIIEKRLIEFKGLVKKINRNKIQIIYRNDEAEEDTLIVNLKKRKK